MTTQHLNKVIAGTLAAMLTCALVPAQALSPIDLSTPKAYADEVSQTRTDIVKATYLTRNSNGTYSLNESALTTQEEWKDLGAVGFFLWAGYDQAADILLNPYDHIKLCDASLSADRYVCMDDLGDAKDATAYDHLQQPIEMVKDWNLARQYENDYGEADEVFKNLDRRFYQFKLDGKKLGMLKISPELMAYEMRAVNFSSTVAFEHTNINGTIAEMLARYTNNYAASDIQSKNNPISGLYFEEKDAILHNEILSKGNGHFKTVVNTAITVAGAGLANDRTSVYGSYQTVYGYAAVTKAQAEGSFNLTVMEIDDYQAKLNAYKAFVSSLPSDKTSGIDPDTSASGTTKPTPENAPKPTFAYGTDYTYAADPDGGPAGVTYPTITYAGSPVTLDVIITDAKGNRLVEGTDYTMSYAHNNEITAMTGFRATWTATDVNKKWSLTDEFLIAEAKADTSTYTYKWSGKLSAYTIDLTGAYVKIANKAQTFLYTADGAKASVGWHTVDGKRYYCAEKGTPVYVDCTIDGTAYTATWDAASQTYYLVKAQANTTPSKPSQPETPTVPKPSKPETPVAPSKPSKPETPVVPAVPSKPTTPSNPNATKPVTPSAPDTSEADKRAEEEAKKAAEEARKKAEAEAAAKRKAAAEAAAKKKAQEEAAKKAALAKKNGWRTEGGYRLYYVKGTPLTGWQTIAGKKYYLKSNGQMAKGWQKIKGKKYYFKSNGRMVTGWQKISGKTYYFDGNGAMLKGFAAPAVKAKSAKSAKKRSLTVKWAKPKVKKAKVCAYQVRYSLKKSMAGAKKSKTVKGKSVTLTKLKSGKRYYVQVRYQVKVNGKKCWTGWGKAVRSGKVK